MIGYQLSEHARDMLSERKILETWVNLALEYPEKRETMEDSTVHRISGH